MTPIATTTAPPGVPSELWADLDARQRLALAVLTRDRAVGTADLARALGMPIGRVNGFMSQLERTLHDGGHRLFRSEVRPDGEPQYVVVPPSRP